MAFPTGLKIDGMDNGVLRPPMGLRTFFLLTVLCVASAGGNRSGRVGLEIAYKGVRGDNDVDV